MKPSHSVSATRIIAAPPSAIFNLLADPLQHPRLDGSGSVTKLKRGPHRLYLGATFIMHMKMGVGYLTRNKVVAFEEDRCIAWHHFAQFVWRYDLEELADGTTRVTETFEYDKPWGFLIERAGIPQKNRVAMEATLERLAQIVTS